MAQLGTMRTKFYGGDGGAEMAFLQTMFAKGYTAASVFNATDQVLTGKGTTKIGSSGSLVTVSNTASKTAYVTQSLGVAQAGDEFVLTAWGDCYNSVGSVQNITLDVAVGATSVATGLGTVASGSSSNRRRWWFEMNLIVTSTTAQSVGGIITVSPNASNVGNTYAIGTPAFQGNFYNAITEDLSTAKDLVLSVTLGTASTALDWRCGGYSLARRR